VFLSLFSALLALSALPAGGPSENRITEPIRAGRRIALAGHVPAQARADNDQGRVPRDLRIASMTLVLKPSDAQQADLDRLLAAATGFRLTRNTITGSPPNSTPIASA